MPLTNELMVIDRPVIEHLNRPAKKTPIKGLVYLMCEINSSAVDDETTEQILKDSGSTKMRLLKFRKTGTM